MPIGLRKSFKSSQLQKWLLTNEEESQKINFQSGIDFLKENLAKLNASMLGFKNSASDNDKSKESPEIKKIHDDEIENHDGK